MTFTAETGSESARKQSAQMSPQARKRRAQVAAAVRWHKASVRRMHEMLDRLMTVYPPTDRQQKALLQIHRLLARNAARTENQHA